jgi:uncharacterized membrane protein
MAAKVMADMESLLARWQAAGVVDAETAARIRAHEALVTTKNARDDRGNAGAKPAASIGLHWQGITALVLGAILLACGVVLFVSAHWDELGPAARYALVCAMVAVFHLAGGLARANYRGLSSALHAVGTVATGAAIALVGQIFNIEEHWPGAVLLWALAALAGWAALRDQAQKTLSLLLIPAWVLSEIGYRADSFGGAAVYMGRFLFVWAILYITFFLGSRQKAVQGILFAAGAIATFVGVSMMLVDWGSWSSTQMFHPFSVRVWAWIAIAAVPLIVAAFHGHKGLIPIAAAVALVIALPWCYHTAGELATTHHGREAWYTETALDLLAYLLAAGFAVFLCWWGVRLASRALVNLGVVGFALVVGWFYFGDIMDKMDRSLGLIGLGVLFLVGGWALEKMRRKLLAGLGQQVSVSAS